MKFSVSNLFRSTGVALLLAMVGATAQAGGPTVVPADPAPQAPMSPVLSDDWSGFSAGLSFAKPKGENFWYGPGPGSTTVEDWDGRQAALALGRDWQRGNLVYGLGLSYGFGEYTTEPQSAALPCVSCELEVSKLATLRARVGLAMGKTLIYATAGLSRADATATYNAGADTAGEGPVSGQTLGIGLEQMIGSRMSISAEYVKTDLGRLDLDTYCGNAICYTDIEFDQLQLGLNLRF